MHKPVLAMPQQVQPEGDESATDIHKRDKEPVGIITDKRTTRNSTLYQVYVHVRVCYTHFTCIFHHACILVYI